MIGLEEFETQEIEIRDLATAKRVAEFFSHVLGEIFDHQRRVVDRLKERAASAAANAMVEAAQDLELEYPE